MQINSDFSQRATVRPDQHEWVDSPQPGVQRVMLDRIGGEVARATSLVRYAAGSVFPPHQHGGGEEILVLSGTFSDEGGDYPAGWYLRNPPGSSHAPASRPGAVIFVKLRQMRDDDQRVVRVDTSDPSSWVPGSVADTCELFDDGREHVRLIRLRGGASWPITGEAGAELLVVEGRVTIDGAAFPSGTWARFPAGDRLALVAGDDGALVYVKTGHLAPPTG